MTSTHWEKHSADLLQVTGWIIRHDVTPATCAAAVLLGAGAPLLERQELLHQSLERAHALREPRIAETCARLLRLPDEELALVVATTLTMLRAADRGHGCGTGIDALPGAHLPLSVSAAQ
jgi:hypothetical protein